MANKEEIIGTTEIHCARDEVSLYGFHYQRVRLYLKENLFYWLDLHIVTTVDILSL
jgi:hypothetical protein